MTLHELKTLLAGNAGRSFRLRLPGGSAVPLSFHITEVGRVAKTFLDCGGKRRDSVTCQLQVWVGPDYDHRLETGRMAAILEKADAFLPDGNVPVEVEYEEQVLSQYTIRSHEVAGDAVILDLAHKHTECLAPELCGVAPLQPASTPGAKPCCGPSGCC